MSTSIPLPALGDAVESATISHWLKAVGDYVAQGEPMVEVSTDKVDTEIESPAAGVLTEILIAEDEVAPVGAIIAVIDERSKSTTEAPLPGPSSSDELSAVTESVSESDPNAVLKGAASKASPISSTPVPIVSEAEPPDQALTVVPTVVQKVSLRGTTQQLSRLRKTIATRMVDSLKTSAQVTTIVEVDMTMVGDLRSAHNSSLLPGRTKLSYLPFIAAAAVASLRRFPPINSEVNLEAGTIIYHDVEHLGIAVDTEKGLFVPVVRDAGTLSIVDLAVQIADVADRTRASRISVDDLAGGTFTITNTGSRGALMDTPIINQPQVAILGAGVVARRPAVMGTQRDGESIAIRSMVYLSLTYDHRVVDGADAARYLSDVKNSLELGEFDVNEVPS